MKIGDTVVWTSQSAGRVKTKTGAIVLVVPAGQDPCKMLAKGWNLKTPGSPRDHESYLVRQGKRVNLNWPVVSLLRTNIRMVAPLTTREYARQDGIVCPACHTKNCVVGERFEAIDAIRTIRDCHCTQCGATWQEDHRLVGYDKLVPGS